MRTHTLIDRPARVVTTAGAMTRVPALQRQIIRSRAEHQITRAPVRVGARQTSLSFEPDPHLDYGRALTPEGGILIIYKDHDLRLRHTVRRVLTWTVFTGAAAFYLFHLASIDASWMKAAGLMLAAVANWLIVKRPIECYRKIEIRPDCMILNDADVFWRHFMGAGFPAFQADKDGNQSLSGIYGTRFIEFLTARRLDDNDRMAELLMIHLQDAMNQLWNRLISS